MLPSSGAVGDLRACNAAGKAESHTVEAKREGAVTDEIQVDPSSIVEAVAAARPGDRIALVRDLFRRRRLVAECAG